MYGKFQSIIESSILLSHVKIRIIFKRNGVVAVLLLLLLLLLLRVRVQIIRHARTHCVCKYQSCMFSNVGLIVHAPVLLLLLLLLLAWYPEVGIDSVQVRRVACIPYHSFPNLLSVMKHRLRITPLSQRTL